MRLTHRLVAAACAALIAGTAAAIPYPRAGTPAAVDLGATENVEPSTVVTLTVVLKLRNAEQMQTLLQAVSSPDSSQYRRFLTTEEFAAQFGPSEATIARVMRHFRAAGFAVARSATAHLKITASVATVQREFGVHLHSYRVPAGAETAEYGFRAPDSAAQLSADIADSVEGVLGLSTRPRYHPNVVATGRMKPAHRGAPLSRGAAAAPNTPNLPGEWTVVDFAQYYDVNPLYQRGLSGFGNTVGIVTLASFTPSDAWAYWAAVRVDASTGRISEVLVDGGAGPPSDAAGSMETTLDVEQSGGIAGGAQVRVYEAPNTAQGFIDAFARAVDENSAESVSVSWGEWEYLDGIAADDVIDPTNPKGPKTTLLTALADVLAQAAVQGQTFFCAAGDSGAYDANNSSGLFAVPAYPKVLSVDDPAAQQSITAAGGTTLPGPQEFLLLDGSIYTINIATEQAWGWDYLNTLCALYGLDPVSCGIFPVGGGGGVSSYVPLPTYQKSVPGIAVTPSHQVLSGASYPQLGIHLPVVLRGGFAGRNVPDISLNADPDTGYVIWYTSDVWGFDIYPSNGGTSFAAPQLNGVTALYDQALLPHRLGLLNPMLYKIATSSSAYSGPNAPLRDISAGDNWHWRARRGYDQATGVGVPDVANLLQALEPMIH